MKKKNKNHRILAKMEQVQTAQAFGHVNLFRWKTCAAPLPAAGESPGPTGGFGGWQGANPRAGPRGSLQPPAEPRGSSTCSRWMQSYLVQQCPEKAKTEQAEQQRGTGHGPMLGSTRGTCGSDSPGTGTCLSPLPKNGAEMPPNFKV